jgi:membrane-associated phospholipid phosphatase
MKSLFYDWGGFNLWLFHAINDFRSPLIDSFMLLGTRLGDYGNFPLLLALAAAYGLVAASRGRPEDSHAWLAALAVFSVAYVLEGQILGFLKPWLDYPRPPLALAAGSVHVVGAPELHHSLPSGHAAFAMLVAASLWPVMIRLLRGALIGYVLWVGISRISLGAHFPADVLAGFALSLALVWPLRGLATAMRRG